MSWKMYTAQVYLLRVRVHWFGNLNKQRMFKDKWFFRFFYEDSEIRAGHKCWEFVLQLEGFESGTSVS